MREASHQGHRVWSWLREVSRTCKSIETGIGSVAARGWERGAMAKGYGVSFWREVNVLK